MNDKQHFVVVCGYPDTKKKETILLELLRVLNKMNKFSICYSTHHHNIPAEINRLCDYVIYSNNNPIFS